MSTPDNHGKKAPQFAAFKPLTTVQNANDCCCDGACSSTPTLSENVSGTRYSWKVSGMDCAACVRMLFFVKEVISFAISASLSVEGDTLGSGATSATHHLPNPFGSECRVSL